MVFGLVDEQAIESLPIESNLTGRVTALRFRDMMTTARAIVPDLARVAILGDTFEQQTVFRHFAKEIPVVTSGIEVIDLVGLPAGAPQTGGDAARSHSDTLRVDLFRRRGNLLPAG